MLQIMYPFEVMWGRRDYTLTSSQLNMVIYRCCFFSF
jgi:hypothetical protein